MLFQHVPVTEIKHQYNMYNVGYQQGSGDIFGNSFIVKQLHVTKKLFSWIMVSNSYWI